MRKSLALNDKVISIVLEEVESTGHCFNKVVNDLIIEAIQSREIIKSNNSLQEFLETKFKRIEAGILKLHKEFTDCNKL